jgi:hypothetical protein
MARRFGLTASTGMANPKEQLAILGRLADKLTTKGWGDIGIAALRCPALLSPFGGPMLEALLLKPRRWPIAVTYGLWWANHQRGGRSDIASRIGSRLVRTAMKCVGIMLTNAGRIVRWARRA